MYLPKRQLSVHQLMVVESTALCEREPLKSDLTLASKNRLEVNNIKMTLD